MGRSGAGAGRSEVQCNCVLLFLRVLCLWLYPSCPVNSHEGQRDDTHTHTHTLAHRCVPRASVFGDTFAWSRRAESGRRLHKGSLGTV